MTEAERLAIPEAYRPPPEQTFLRSSIEAIDMPRFGSVTNRVEVLFEAAEPLIAQAQPA